MSEILTTADAAAMLGITEQGVRKLVERGCLEPLSRGARPLSFWVSDVAELEFQRRSPAERERVARLARAFLDTD